MGQRRPDDAVLPGRGPGGATRVRPRRPARAPPVRAAARGGRRRHGRADRHLPAVQRGAAERARVGRRDVDRHRARARPARDARPQRARQGAPVRPHDLRRRRPRRAARDRRRLQRADQRAAAGAGRGGVRAAAGGGPDDAAPLGVLRHRARPVARAGGERRRPGRRGAGHRAVRAGVHAEPRRAGAGDRARAPVPRAADARAGARGHDQPHRHAVAERAAAELLPPVDELRDRPAVRAGQRGRRAVGRLPRHAFTAPVTLGVLVGLRGRQAAGRGGDGVGGDAALPRSDPAARRLGRGAGQRDDRRDRLHRRAAHRHPRVPGGGAGPGEGRRALGRRRVRGADLGWCTG